MSYSKSKPVRVDIEDYIEATRVKDALNRTIQGQISYWSKVGRHVTDNPDLTGREVEKLVIEAGRRKQEGHPG